MELEDLAEQVFTCTGCTTKCLAQLNRRRAATSFEFSVSLVDAEEEKIEEFSKTSNLLGAIFVP